jgi:Rieske Fe-S protein
MSITKTLVSLAAVSILVGGAVFTYVTLNPKTNVATNSTPTSSEISKSTQNNSNPKIQTFSAPANNEDNKAKLETQVKADTDGTKFDPSTKVDKVINPKAQG